MLEKLKQSYRNFKQHLGVAFSYLIYTVSTGRDNYFENQKDLERIIERENILENPRSADEITLQSCRDKLLKIVQNIPKK